MTATAPAVDHPRSPQWQRSAVPLLRFTLVRAAWFWAAVTVVMSIVLFTISSFVAPEMSVVAFGHHAALWFQLAISCGLVAFCFPMHVAHGMTRRSFAQAGLIVAAITSLVYSVAMTTLLVLERSMYQENGWFHGLDSVPGVTVMSAGVAPYLWGVLMLFAAGSFSGLLVAAVYYRVGGWWGTALLPLTLAPLLLIATVALDPITQWRPWNFGPAFSEPWQPVLGVAVLAVAAIAFYLVVR
ncbi:MAG: hypothetical protein WA880_01075, partial [Ornithinimicrobium sp.]